MPTILAWQPNETSDHVLRHLAAGGCVALPTESTYEIVASAFNASAIAGLRNLSQPNRPAACVLFAFPQVADWLPRLGGAGARIFRKMGPGPLTLQAEAGFADGLWLRLPEVARRFVVRDGHLAVRWPAHPVWDDLGQAGVPLISMPFGTGAAVDEITRINLNDLLVVDAGPTQFGKSPSLVRAEGRRCRLQQEGALSREQFDELAVCRILFLCTGNTCRSPMASGLCTKLLADHLACLPSELNQHGFSVQSAGISAMMGAQASPDAVRVASEFGADITQHGSRMVTLDMLLWADHIFAMTAGHWYTIKSIPVPEMPEPRLLSPQGEDVSDPIGGSLADYRSCANQILACLRQRLPELLES